MARYHCPVLDIDFQGSFTGRAAPFCSNSMDCLSGERTKAIIPSRGGRLMVTPAFISRYSLRAFHLEDVPPAK